MALCGRKGSTLRGHPPRSSKERANGKVSAIPCSEDLTGSAHGYKARKNVRISLFLEICYFSDRSQSPGLLSVALDQYYASLTSGDPWRMADDQGNESSQEQDLKPTNSARRVKALIEQVTGQENLVPYLNPCTRILMTGGWKYRSVFCSA